MSSVDSILARLLKLHPRRIDLSLDRMHRLLERLVEYARFDVALEVEPGTAEAEVSEAGSALGRALAAPLREGRGYGSSMMTSSLLTSRLTLAFPTCGPPMRKNTSCRTVGLDGSLLPSCSRSRP